MLQGSGALSAGACPEEVNLARPDAVTAIHRAYAKAGAQGVTTNTFGANRVKLAEYGLGDRVAEVNGAAVAAARRAVGERGLVLGSVGPTGKFVEPLGPLSFREAVGIFSEQAAALARAGADAIKIETMMDLRELKAALLAAREATALPVLCLMTFEGGGATLLGSTPESFGVVAEAMGADAVGMNCSLGPEGMEALLLRLFSATSGAVAVQPNAGVPFLSGDRTVFPMGPGDFGPWIARFRSLGVAVAGGCCGTTPDHVEAARKALFPSGRPSWSRAARAVSAEALLRVASRSRVVTLGGDTLAVVGERINPTGKKAFAAELAAGDLSTVSREAREQAALGADLLDVNVGAPGVDEPALMRGAVHAANRASDLPVVIDSSDPEALLAGLEAADGLPVLNSVTGEAARLASVLPLAARFGAALVCLPFDEAGIPATADGRMRVARRIAKAAEAAGVGRDRLILDGLATTVSADPEAPRAALETVRSARRDLGVPTLLGVSNVSFGLPSRGLVNRTFLAMAAGSGLSAAIANPHDVETMNGVAAARLLLGGGKEAGSFVERFAAAPGLVPGASPAPPQPEGGDPYRRAAAAVVRGDRKGAEAAVREILASGADPLEASSKGLLPGMEEVGRRFERNLVYLPQVMASADAMKGGFAVVKEAMGGKDRASSGKVLLATVEGDVHDIGKNIVAVLLENHGYEVVDLGKSVPAERILEEARRGGADVVGLSALMTTTMAAMGRTVARLREAGLPVLTILGGAVVTEEYAARVGADAYAKDGMEAVRRLGELLSRKGGKGRGASPPRGEGRPKR
jgi:5-methyltetrahydrofolate--homocysteine methyltransferase